VFKELFEALLQGVFFPNVIGGPFPDLFISVLVL